MELVSPDDLRAAAEHFATLRLPVRFRQFPSGVAVVQDESWSDDAACENIMRLFDELEQEGGCAQGDRPEAAASPGAGEEQAGAQEQRKLWVGLRPAQFAVKAEVPVAVAKEQLLLAERVGVLCRDDAAAGLAFFRNIFPSLV